MTCSSEADKIRWAGRRHDLPARLLTHSSNMASEGLTSLSEVLADTAAVLAHQKPQAPDLCQRLIAGFEIAENSGWYTTGNILLEAVGALEADATSQT